MIKIDNQLADATIAKAKLSGRRRMNHNFHASEQDIVQRMLNAIEPGTYIRPHKHENPGKNEVFLVLIGKALILEFDEEGMIADSMVLDPAKGLFGAEIPPGRYHTILSLQSGTVAYEVKEGPYLPATVKCFAPWAPHENHPDAESYLKELILKSGIGDS